MILMLMVSVVSYAGKIHKAVEKDDITMIEKLIKVVDINSRGLLNGQTPLTVASKRGNLKVVKILLSAGADPNKKSRIGKTPLVISIQNGRYDVIKELLKNKATVPLDNLPKSIKSYDLAITELIAKHLCSVKKSQLGVVFAGYDKKPLTIAVRGDKVAAVRLLISSGADIEGRSSNSSGDWSMTPFGIAVYKGYVELSRLLMEKGANKDTYRILIDEGSEYHHYLEDDAPSYLAGFFSPENAADVLRRKILKTGYHGRIYGIPFIVFSAMINNVVLVSALLKHGADINATYMKKTSLYWVSSLGFPSIVKFLLKHKAKFDLRDTWKLTPLHCAVAECIPLLIKAGAKVNVQDKNGWTPLHWAVHWADVDRVRELLKAGADPKIKNKKGQMPIWFIARDYKTFEPGLFTKPIVDLLKNPALAMQDEPVASAPETVPDDAPMATATSTTTSSTTIEAAPPAYDNLFRDGSSSTFTSETS